MDPEKNLSSGQAPDSGTGVLTKTKVDTSVKTMLLIAGSLVILAAAVIVKPASKDVHFWKQYDSPPSGSILYARDGSRSTLFTIGVNSTNKDVVVQKIEFTFQAEKTFTGNMGGMIKNLTLYSRKTKVENYGAGVTYTLEPIAKASALSGSGQSATALFELSVPFLVKAGAATALVLEGEIPTGAPSGQFFTKIANAKAVTAVISGTTRKAKVDAANAKGDWLIVESMSNPVLNVVPSGTLVRGKSYDFNGVISGAKPNGRISVFIQRPDGTLKLSSETNEFTDEQGNWSSASGSQLLTDGQNGTWTAWVTVDGLESNKVKFNVLEGSTAPIVKVVSPNGGEKWRAGQTTNIRWNSQSLPKGSDIIITLQQPESDSAQILFNNVANDKNSVSWKIPAGLAPGSYLIQISAPNLSGDTVDQSDNPFTITR